MSNTPRNLTRNQLAEFLPNQRAVRAFEQLLKQVGDRLPADVVTLNRLIQEAYIEGSIGAARSQEALDSLQLLRQDAAINASAADSKATEALSALRRIADALELIASAPPIRSDNSLSTDHIDISPVAPTAADAVGRMKWNDLEGTVDLGLKGGNVTLQIGQENVLLVKNDDTVQLTDGMAVFVYGASGANLLVRRAKADSEVTSSTTIGVVTESIDVNGQGFVTTFGSVRGLNTNSFNEGDALYLSPTTAGDITNVKPVAPQHMVLIGYCTKKSGGNGEIFVKVDNGYELDELHNVLISSPVAGSLLIYDATNKVWKNTTITAGTNVTVTNADGSITLSVSGAAPTGAAGGVLSGTYPNPGFAVGMATQAELDAHTSNTSNPHSVTKTQVGLSNVTNDAQIKKAASSTNGAIPTWNGTTGDALNTGGLTAPSGAIVGTTDTQTLTNKTLTDPVLNGAGTYRTTFFGTTSGTNYDWTLPAGGVFLLRVDCAGVYHMKGLYVVTYQDSADYGFTQLHVSSFGPTTLTLSMVSSGSVLRFNWNRNLDACRLTLLSIS